MLREVTDNETVILTKRYVELLIKEARYDGIVADVNRPIDGLVSKVTEALNISLKKEED